jgi:hypothetical protein
LREITTAALSKRLAAIGHPIADTGITKTEKGDRRVDVDDLVALALALGVTPNTLLLPPADSPGTHQLTPEVSATATELWEWAQGEKPLRIEADAGRTWLGDGEFPSLEFSLRTRPYLMAVRNSGKLPADPVMHALAIAVSDALANGVSGPVVRRTVELVIGMPAVAPHDEIAREIRKIGGVEGEQV